MGAADITAGQTGRMRKPEYRKMYEDAYQADFKQYGHDLNLDEANKMLVVTRKELRDYLSRRREDGSRSHLSKKELLALNPALMSPEDINGRLTIDNPFELGEIAERLYAEKLATIRLWVHFKEYVMGVVPDGIEDNYVYEFKATTQSGTRIEDVKRKAVRQGQLYAYAFKRPNIKVQVARFELDRDQFPIKVEDLLKPEISTITKPASQDDALRILHNFDLAFRGCSE